MIFASIDPGSVHAAVAVFRDGHPLFVDDIRATNGMLDAVAFGKALKDMNVAHVVVENVHAMPGQGIASTFKFGMGCGIIHGVIGCLQIPMTLVSATKWKTAYNLGSKKEASRQRAIRQWPHLMHALARKKDADRAEALLIGEWFYINYVVPRTKGPDYDGSTDVSLSAASRNPFGQG